MKVLYYNNSWFTNVGEAFIDIGAMELIGKIFDNVQIATYSNMSNYYVMNAKMELERKISDIYDMSNDYDADYLVLSGMFATKELENSVSAQRIKKIVKNGAKLLLIGIGGYEYTEEEFLSFKRFIEATDPILMTTRDKITFDAYKNDVLCISAIDSALWVKDVYNPKGFSKKDFNVSAFNRTKEPEECMNMKGRVVRPYHFQYGYSDKAFRKDILISDSPYDYLTVYANAKLVYTDLVHATLASLMYGTPVKYFYCDKRSYAFEAIEGIIKNKDSFLSVAEIDLENQKTKIVESIRNALKGV